MIVIVCLDDEGGMMFNKRRQSSDTSVIDKIVEEVAEKTIYMNAYSYKQFSSLTSTNIIVSEDFLSKAKQGGYCFVESVNLCNYKEKIERLIIFRWNRKYPSDLKLDILLENWKAEESLEFTGHSHEKITKEVYIK